jgi:hypothetical protein
MTRPWLGPLVGLTTAACGSSVPHPPYAPQATSALTPVDTAPPPGRVEQIPPRPPQADAWIDGEWLRRHGRWYWLLGRWVKTPPRTKYAPWVFVRAADGSGYYAPSIWVSEGGAVAQPPAPLALARANGQAVFNAEGEVEDTGRSLATAPASHAAPSTTSR